MLPFIQTYYVCATKKEEREIAREMAEFERNRGKRLAMCEAH